MPIRQKRKLQSDKRDMDMKDLECLQIYRFNMENGAIPFNKDDYKALCSAIDKARQMGAKKETKYA